MSNRAVRKVYEAGRRLPNEPISAREALQLWRQHVATQHVAAGHNDVVKWHRKNYPGCAWDIGSFYFLSPFSHPQSGRITGTDGVTR